MERRGGRGCEGVGRGGREDRCWSVLAVFLNAIEGFGVRNTVLHAAVEGVANHTEVSVVLRCSYKMAGGDPGVITRVGAHLQPSSLVGVMQYMALKA